jgi:hypothetical protein
MEPSDRVVSALVTAVPVLASTWGGKRNELIRSTATQFGTPGNSSEAASRDAALLFSFAKDEVEIVGQSRMLNGGFLLFFGPTGPSIPGHHFQ